MDLIGNVPAGDLFELGVLNVLVPSGGDVVGAEGYRHRRCAPAPGRPWNHHYGNGIRRCLDQYAATFWALPLLGITGLEARHIVGYTVVVMLAAGGFIGAVLLFF